MTPLPKEFTSKMAALLRSCHTLIYGRYGVGKTTLACSYPKAGLLSWDPDYKFVDPAVQVAHFTQGPEGWAEFKELLDKVEERLAGRLRVVVDGVASMHDACSRWVCAQHNVDHPEKLPHGRGWALISQELQRQVSRLVKWAESRSVGLIFIGHDEVVTGKMLNTEYARVQPKLGAALERTLLSLVDFVWYLGYDPTFGAALINHEAGKDMPKRDGKLIPDVRAMSPNRLIVFNGGEHVYTKMRSPTGLVLPYSNRKSSP